MLATAASPACGRYARAPKRPIRPPISTRARKNDAYKLDRSITPEEINAHYNNFYEFGTHKDIADNAQNLIIRPWEIAIDGLVEKPFTIAFDDLVRKIRWKRGSIATAASKRGR